MAPEQCAPHATAWQCVAASDCTMRGLRAASVWLPSFPVPSWPCELEPQARTSPSPVTTRTCSVPRATPLIRCGHRCRAVGTDGDAPPTARPHIHSVHREVGSALCLGLGPRASSTSSPRTMAARTSSSSSAGPRDVTKWQAQPSRPRFAAMKAWRRPTVEAHQAAGSLMDRSCDPSRRWKLKAEPTRISLLMGSIQRWQEQPARAVRGVRCEACEASPCKASGNLFSSPFLLSSHRPFGSSLSVCGFPLFNDKRGAHQNGTLRSHAARAEPGRLP